MLWLYYSRYSPCFKSIVEVMSKILSDNNIENTITNTLYDNDDVWIVWYPNINKLPKKCILYNMDPMTPDIMNGMDTLIKNNTGTTFQFLDFCYSPKTDEYYNKRGYKYTVLLYGISKHQQINSISTNKDIDILFYGGLNQKRINILNDLQLHCKSKGYNMVLRINDLYDENEKANLVHRSKIVLSIPSEPAQYGQINDLARLSFLITNKAFIIGEVGGDKMIESLSGINYIKQHKLKETIDYYIENEDKRNQNVELVYDNFNKFFNLDKDLIYFLQA